MLIKCNKMTNEQLLRLFAEGLADKSTGVFKAACAYVTLVERGVDVSHITWRGSRFYPEVASGRLLPGMIELLDGVADANVNVIKTLVPEIQEQLIRDYGRVDILNSDGKQTRKSRIFDLSASELNRLIGDGNLRTIAQQARFLPAQPVPTKPTLAKPVTVEEHTRARPGARPEASPRPDTVSAPINEPELEVDTDPSPWDLGDALSLEQQTFLESAAEEDDISIAELIIRVLEGKMELNGFPSRPRRRGRPARAETRASR